MANVGAKPTETKWDQLYDGEWFTVADIDNFKLQCCDCGLVHDVKFKIRGKGKRLDMVVSQNKKETAKVRRKV